MESFLVAEKTKTDGKGDGPAIDISGAMNRVLLLTVKITHVIEQESLDVAIQGSNDGTTWAPKALANFPQQFYRGETPLLLDLTGQADVRYIRAHWAANRWGRGEATPMFEFQVALKEVPSAILQEVRSRKSA